MPSIFSQIIANEIPSYKIFEDELTLAFLDINPVNLGHTLVVPKLEVDYFVDLPEPYYTRVFQNALVVTKAIQKATGCLRVCTWIEGFAVPHFHYHLCPFYVSQGEFWVKRGELAKSEDLKQIQTKILASL